MPSPTSPIIRKSTRPVKKRVISDPSSSPVTTKKIKPKNVRPKSIPIDVSLLDATSSDNPVLPDELSTKSSKSDSVRKVYSGYSRKYLYKKWVQTKDLVDSETRKKFKLIT